MFRRALDDARVQHMDEGFLGELDRLEAAGRMQDLDFAGVVARIATDRFCALTSPSRLDMERFVAVMERALERAPADDAARIAERIAGRTDLPERMLWRLTLCSGQAGAIALRLAPRPSTRLLTARAEGGSAEEATVIAARPDIDRSVVMALVRRAEPDPMRALVANVAAPLDSGLVLALVQRARFDEPLARALLARHVVGLDIAPLFLNAASDIRRQIMLEVQKDALGRTGDGALEAARREAMAAALAGNAKAFATRIALALRSNRVAIDRMIEEPGGEPLALLLAALGANVAQALDAFAVLRPAFDAERAAGAMLALQMNAHAATRLVRAIVHGTLKAPDAQRQNRSGLQRAEEAARAGTASARDDAGSAGRAVSRG